MIFGPLRRENRKADNGNDPQHRSDEAKRAVKFGGKQDGDHRRETQEKTDGAEHGITSFGTSKLKS